jgi:glycosyltransferase involved in cell wall biosynthesis
VFTSHGLAFEEDRNVFARSAIYFATWMTFVLSTCVITITHSNYARARRMWGCTKKVQLVHNGIAPLAFLSQEDARAALLQQTGSAVDHDALWLGSIGEYTWNKGLHFAIRAVSDLTQQGKKVVLFLLGDGEERTFFETLIDQESLAGKVFLAGFTPDAHRFLPAFDVFVVPSIKEGLPYVLLEAGQAGSAVVATRTGGIPDIVEHQQTGLLVQPKHEHALAKSIGTLVDTAQLRTTYAQALRARTTSEFSLARMIEKTSTIYKS